MCVRNSKWSLDPWLSGETVHQQTDGAGSGKVCVGVEAIVSNIPWLKCVLATKLIISFGRETGWPSPPLP